MAPIGPATPTPIPAPATLVKRDPPNCPACSTVAKGRSFQLKSYHSPSGFINRADADS